METATVIAIGQYVVLPAVAAVLGWMAANHKRAYEKKVIFDEEKEKAERDSAKKGE